MKVLITGDSHIGCLYLHHRTARRARRQSGNALSSSDVRITMQRMGPAGHLAGPFFEDRGDHAEILDPEHREFMERLPPADTSYDWIGLCAPLNASRIWTKRWSNLRPWQMASESGAAVSGNVIRRIISDDARHLLAFLDVIRRTTAVFVVEPPWPFRDHPAMKTNGPDKSKYLHRQYRDHVMTELQDRNIPVVEIDPAWLDADGFMDPQFQRDPLHGNAEFARLMMERIGSFLDDRASAVSAVT